jgi:hypothetical protein
VQCPACHQDQVIVEYRGVELDVCLEGCGVWFDGQEVRQLFEAAGVPDRLHDLEGRFTALEDGPPGPKRRCPRCRATMPHVGVAGASGQVVLDRCPRGHGLWFDRGELEDVLAADEQEGEAPAFAEIKEFLGRFASGSSGAPGPPGPSEGS